MKTKKISQELDVDFEKWLKLGQSLRPIFDFIDFDSIIIDMLHLLLRIGEKLISLLMKDILKLLDWETRFECELQFPLSFVKNFI